MVVLCSTMEAAGGDWGGSGVGETIASGVAIGSCGSIFSFSGGLRGRPRCLAGLVGNLAALAVAAATLRLRWRSLS